MEKVKKTKSIEILAEYLIGKILEHKNEHYRVVRLKVESVKVKGHYVQITPDTKENDYYGQSKEWDTIEITFEDGSSIEVELDEDLIIV